MRIGFYEANVVEACAFSVRIGSVKDKIHGNFPVKERQITHPGPLHNAEVLSAAASAGRNDLHVGFTAPRPIDLS